MTVAIATICNMGSDRPPCVVAACDRMITIRGLQYEPQQRKAAQLATTTIALFAGDMQLHASVTPKTDERLKELSNERDPPRLTVKEIAGIYAEEFAYYRRKLAEREVLFPRGMDFDKFARLQTTLPHYQVRDLDAMIAAHTIDSTAIIAGLDHLGAHIYVVRDPGVADSYAIPCFACAGSGKDIAEAQFMVAQYEKQWPLSKALWLTYWAKASAQVAGGVGPKTDLMIISPGNIEYATEQQTQFLFGMFGRVRRKEREYNDEAVARLEANMEAARQRDQQQQTEQTAAGPDSGQQPARKSDAGEPPATSS
jgi:hypothetical protein